MAKFEELRTTYHQYTLKLEGLFKEILDVNNIDYEVIESRTKTTKSFIRKISHPGKSYSNPLHDMSDISGLRIVLHYLEDVENVSQLIRNEFTIDELNSIDKGQALRPNEFGYRSVHYIVSLKKPRVELVEWKPFRGLKAEIQVRTVLQHAWAAVSRTLDYTHENDVPSVLRRRLFRLSGLFEIADEEFSAIRTAHAQEASRISTKLDRGEMDVELNLDSIQQYVKHSTLIESIVDKSKKIGYNVVVTDDKFYPRLLNYCIKSGLNTVKDLARIIELMDKRSEEYLKEQFEAVDRGIREWTVSVEFLVCLLVIGGKRKHFTADYLAEDGWDAGIASRVLKVADKQ